MKYQIMMIGNHGVGKTKLVDKFIVWVKKNIFNLITNPFLESFKEKRFKPSRERRGKRYLCPD